MCDDAESFEMVLGEDGKYRARCKGCGQYLTLSRAEQAIAESHKEKSDASSQ